MLRKPNKINYTVVKFYQIIRLLNSLGKVCKKMAADMLADWCKVHSLLYGIGETDKGSGGAGSGIIQGRSLVERPEMMEQRVSKTHQQTGRVVTGMMLSAPVGVVIHEAGLQPPLSVLNNRQSRYGYRLLAAPVTLSAYNILPVSLREGDEQAQPGEQQEGYNE